MENDRGGDSDDGGYGSRPSPQNKRQPGFLSNHNFDNYLKMRNLKKEDLSSSESVAQDQGGQKNHFTTPLDPSRETFSSHLGISAAKSPTRSVFSDLERSQTVDRFAKIFMERMGDAMSSGKLSQAWNSSSSGSGSGSSIFSLLLTDYSPGANDAQSKPRRINPEDYAAERKMVEPHFTPLIWGSSCMFITLFSMRLGRWYQGRYVGRTLSSSTRTNHTATSQGTSSMKSLQDVRHAGKLGNSSPFNPRNEMKNEMMSSLSTLPVDMALSILFGISTTIFLTQPQYLMKDFSSAPLCEGKSVVAEELCVPFTEKMEVVNAMFHTYTPYNNNKLDNVPEQRQVVPYSDLWKEENLGEFDSLRAIRDFVANCHEREKVARQVLAIDADGDSVSTQELMEIKIPPQNEISVDHIE